MENEIFIQLLEEGTIVYRPVNAEEIGNNLYKVKGEEIYDPSDEIWEFKPGTIVMVEEQNLSEKSVLVATKAIEMP